VANLRVELDEARAGWDELGEVELTSGLDYGDGEPVRVSVRKRGNRYDIDDRGRAVEKARVRGRRGWLELATRVATDDALNINRAGVVFVPAYEGRDIAGLAERVAATSLAVYGALLELDEE
jgi:hypothetical protein